MCLIIRFLLSCLFCFFSKSPCSKFATLRTPFLFFVFFAHRFSIQFKQGAVPCVCVSEGVQAGRQVFEVSAFLRFALLVIGSVE
jgi:hypothetical protein